MIVQRFLQGLFALIVPLSILIAPLPALAAARGVADPATATRAHYQAMLAGHERRTPDLPFTDRLDGLRRLDLADFGPDEVPRLDFDIYMNAQDGEVRDIMVSSRAVDNAPGRRVVVVLFTNFGEPRETHFFWERGQDGRWRVDDVKALNPDGGWTLSLLLKYGFDSSEANGNARRRKPSAHRIAATGNYALSHR